VDSNKLGVGQAIAGVSGLLLFIFMFLPWYGIESVGGFGIDGADVSAWEAFSFIDVLLFLITVVVVGLVLVQLAEATPDLPRPPAQIMMAAGAVAFVLILFRLIVAPGVDGDLGLEVDLGRKLGILLSLIAAAGITYGRWRATNESQPE
jgi:hypothetical protein